ncbi:hypothetical protein [Streptomyces sp. NPDC017520]|uniref:hypothetical protein n=1 Tax=Streptomyces sp. NPDC017520 TaxID=3364998 RepID=UPI0037ABF978
MRESLRLRTAVAFVGLALFVSGCGSSREYAIPKEACGVPMGEKELTPLLPHGEKLDVVGDSVVKKVGSYCSINVDNYRAVSFSVEQVDKFYDPMGELDSFRFTNRKKMAPLPFDGSGAMGDRNVMISTPCGLPQADHLVVFLIAGEKATKDVNERRSDMEAFMLDFVPRVKKTMACPAA